MQYLSGIYPDTKRILVFLDIRLELLKQGIRLTIES